MIFNADEKYVTVHGRTLFIDNVRYINYSLSGTAFKFRGKSLKARLTSDYKPNPDCGDIFLPFCAVLVNGEMTKRFEVSAPEGIYDLYESDSDDEVEIELVKMSEAAFGKVGIVEFISDSDIPPVPVEKKKLKLEFVGDSLTCGYGIEGKNGVDVFNTRQENPYKAYAAQTARKLNADFDLISWSGIGILSSWVDDKAVEPLTNWLSPVLYPCTDAGYSNDLHQEPFEQWDFSRFVPDAIIINLGTNDESWTKGIPEREEEFSRKYADYLKLIRSKNPEAVIVCAYGAMLDTIFHTVEKAVELFKAETGDDKVFTLHFTVQNEERDGIGADFHPSQNTHDRMASELAAKLAELGVC